MPSSLVVLNTNDEILTITHKSCRMVKVTHADAYAFDNCTVLILYYGVGVRGSLTPVL